MKRRTNVTAIGLIIAFLLPVISFAQETSAMKPDGETGLKKLQLPSGPAGPGRFGAYYTKLE